MSFTNEVEPNVSERSPQTPKTGFLVELLSTLEDPAFSVKEVAWLLKVHPETVRRWCRRGRIAYFQVGRGAIRIPASSLDGIRAKRIRPGTKMVHRLK